MNTPAVETQNADVLAYMQTHGTITSMDAIDKLRITRLSARIYDLKKQGYEIEGQNRTKKDADGRTIRWKEYWLA